MLTFLVFFPVLGAIVIATLPRDQERQAKYMALAVTGVLLIVSLVMFGLFDRGAEGLQFTESFRWIDAGDAGFEVQYFLGVDGLSLTMRNYILPRSLSVCVFGFRRIVFVLRSTEIKQIQSDLS